MKNLFAAIICLFTVSLALVFAQENSNRKTRLFLVGDSTMADKPLNDNPERGWGQILPRYFNEQVEIRNHAVNGRSTKSFRDEGCWDAVLKDLQNGDWVFIQFGHNDQKSGDPKRFASANTDYRSNLVRYITEARAKGAKVVLLTPIMRRRFDERGEFVDSHGEYPAAVKAVAKELNVPLIDMHRKSQTVIEQHGVKGSKKIFLHIPADHFAAVKEDKKDDTHFSEYGARFILLPANTSLCAESESKIRGTDKTTMRLIWNRAATLFWKTVFSILATTLSP
jgi:DNA sulfur modification protein DndE